MFHRQNESRLSRLKNINDKKLAKIKNRVKIRLIEMNLSFLLRE